MSDIRMLVEIEILGFIDFLSERGYFLKNDNDENSRITYPLLQTLMKVYLDKGEGVIEG